MLFRKVTAFNALGLSLIFAARTAAAPGLFTRLPSARAHAAYTADRLPKIPIVSGYRRAYALQDGVLNGLGFDAGGELGDGAPGVLSRPRVNLTRVKQVAHSHTHAIALEDDGTLWT